MDNVAILEAYIFILAVLMGFQLISKVPSVLHTPLMSATNAIHGIILVGAMLVAGMAQTTTEVVLSAFAVFLATLNVVGGYAVTDRMLAMFRKKDDKKGGQA
ncbi:MAG: NAD(P) transhydrogenase subunit alpha [Clostridiales bacterium]|nr:NAD(P) transhydrogenase subunit alpha [Clostridiales bacterium]MBT9259229.1 NAD(P) transhydrogenase subunit alpha [Clostridiales bacterium]